VPEIPIQNLYYLFCYAWRHFRSGAAIDVGRIENPTIPNLLATVLINGTRHILRRGLDRGFCLQWDDLSSLRGKIEISETIKRNLALKTQAHCSYDEFLTDTPVNQILKASLRSLIAVGELDQELRIELRQLARNFGEVSNTRMGLSQFRQVHIHRNNRIYDFLMHVCQLVYESTLPEQDQRGGKFKNVLDDEVRMGAVFEEFVRNFLKSEQSGFSVKREEIAWDAMDIGGDGTQRLPRMITDITLRSPERTIVIDTKFYKRTLSKSQHGDIAKIHSENLYQIYAYIRNMENREGPDSEAEGILLYPTVDQAVDLAYEIQGHRIRVKTLNLSQDWPDIRSELLQLIA
jgi:5-methylcytosine-specific restriction enzyme subunit McrC